MSLSMRNLVGLILLWMGACGGTLAQNLIPNPGFEISKRCPKRLGELKIVLDWNSPNGGSPDYFNVCYTRDPQTVGIPNNYFSTQPRKEGNAYAGIFAGDSEIEYLQVKLEEDLVAGEKYHLRFYGSPLSATGDQMDAVKVWMREGALQSEDWARLEAEGEVLAPKFKRERSISDWTEFYHEFEAQGGEDHFIIGYFGATEGRAYTYLDDFFLGDSMAWDNLKTLEKGGRPKIPLPIVEGNFIPNPGFEAHHEIPTARAQFNYCGGWLVTSNTPDYYHRKGGRAVRIPSNEFGEQEAHGGDAYAGVFAQVRRTYREFVQAELIDTLVPGEVYCLSAWVNLSDRSACALEDFQMLPSRRPLLKPSLLPAKDPRLVIMTNPQGILKDKENWVQVSAAFVANGGESILTIGNFRKPGDPAIVKLPKEEIASTGTRKRPIFAYNSDLSYYYFDDVVLCEVTDPISECPDDLVPQVVADPDDPNLFRFATEEEEVEPEPEPEPVMEVNWEVGDTLVLENFLFAYDDSQLADEALPLLDELATYLARKPKLNIVVTGHTDDQGSDAYNQKLSLARAKSVKAYLGEQGLSLNRCQAEGKGESEPVVPNDSEAQRAINRRVEIRFLEGN